MKGFGRVAGAVPFRVAAALARTSAAMTAQPLGSVLTSSPIKPGADFADNRDALVERRLQFPERFGKRRRGFFQLDRALFQIVRRFLPLGLIGGDALGFLRLRDLDIHGEQGIFERQGMNFGAMDFVFGAGLFGVASTGKSRLDGIMARTGEIVLRLLEFEGEVLPALVEGLRLLENG